MMDVLFPLQLVGGRPGLTRAVFGLVVSSLNAMFGIFWICIAVYAVRRALAWE